jgi:hypothetical protein
MSQLDYICTIFPLAAREIEIKNVAVEVENRKKAFEILQYSQSATQQELDDAHQYYYNLKKDLRDAYRQFLLDNV